MDESLTHSRNQSLGEEIANSVSHGVGALAAIAVTPIMIVKAVPLGATAIAGVSIFGATMIVLYLSSSLYHAFPHNKTKRVFRIFDHSAAFLARP
jgi:hemolysin III